MSVGRGIPLFRNVELLVLSKTPPSHYERYERRDTEVCPITTVPLRYYIPDKCALSNLGKWGIRSYT